MTQNNNGASVEPSGGRSLEWTFPSCLTLEQNATNLWKLGHKCCQNEASLYFVKIFLGMWDKRQNTERTPSEFLKNRMTLTLDL